MSMAARITLMVLVFDAVALAAVELAYLPLRVGAVPLPITILLAAVSTPWLVRSAAELGGPRWVAAVPLVVWLLALGVLGVAGPGVTCCSPRTGDRRCCWVVACSRPRWCLVVSWRVYPGAGSVVGRRSPEILCR